MTERTEESFQVSPQQEQLWLGSPDGPDGRVQAIVSLSDGVDADALRAALSKSVARHEILRTTFLRQAGIRVPLQVVRDQLAPAWESVDAIDDALLAAQELSAPFDFEAGPLLRGAVVTRDGAPRTLILTFSSLIADTASAALVVRELSGEATLVEEPLQYADYSAWQLELQASEDPEAKSAAEFWRDAEEQAASTIPFARPTSSPSAAEMIEIRVQDDLSAEASKYGVSTETLVQAAWSVVVARSAAAHEATVATISASRRHADLDGAIGALSRSVPVRAEIPPGTTFAEVLQAIGRARDQALVWQDYAPTDPTVRFGVGFIEAHGAAAGPLTLERVIDTGRGLTLAITCTTGVGGARVGLSFDPCVHTRDCAQLLAARLERTLDAVAADAGVAVSEIDLLGEAERRRLLIDFNDTAAETTSRAAHELFAAHAAAAPDRAAVIDEHGTLSYGELDARANQLANRLVGLGVGPGVAVGLCTDRSAEMLVGLLGILKAGGAYVPLHYEHPRARLLAQLETVAAVAIVTQEPLLSHLPDFGGAIVCLDRDRAELDGQAASAPDVSVPGDELAYVIYTSGSTGTPKGVGVTHANLSNYAAFIARRLGADGEPMSFGVVTSISTDLGNTSVFGGLCSGGTVVLISPVVAADSGAVAKQFASTPVDVLKITPSHAGALLAGGDAGVLPRRWLVIGGERAPWDLIDRVRAVSEVAILNHYGPTEATIGCCTFRVGDGPGEYAPATVPIGGPVDNASCYLLDEQRRPVPLGAAGTLFIGGAGIARGYVGQPELTAERFVEDPFADGAGARMYDTGDLARWLPDGNLEFLGRADEQVKIRGYRVELGEVEAVLRKHPLVTEAVVIARPGSAGDFKLVAYCAASGPTDPGDLRAHLQAWVPEFMVPAQVAVLDSLPQTPSGKIDRLALPDPDTISSDGDEGYVAPSTPLEEELAKIWSHVLGVERVGAHDDFFALGGHSLLATQVVAQVRSEFAVDLPLHSLFAYPTITTLATEIVRMMGDSEGDETARLMAELEGLSDEEAQRLLASEGPPPEPGAS